MAEISRYTKEDLVYVDESGIDQFVHYPWGYVLRGQKVHGEISGKRYDRESFVAGKVNSRVID